MIDFQNNSYVVVKNFIDPLSVSTLSKYLENSLRRYPENNQGGGGDTSSRISWYADPLMEVVLQNSLSDVEKNTGLSLFPSYSFTRVYQKGDELKPHVDRPACEISVTCHITTVGEPWGIWMQTPGTEPKQHFLEPGDACIYRGCEVKHWREQADKTNINVQMMLHYVDQKGPNAHYKFDKRTSLGLRKGG
jgi:hypothetical protein